MRRVWIAALCLTLLLVPESASAFKFSEDGQAEKQETMARAQQTMGQLSEPCKASLKGKKIAVLIGEKHSGGLAYNAKGHGLLADELNVQLQRLGLNTVSQAQINAQVAAAEARAILNNDPDAALAASSRLGASFMLNGVISSREDQAMSMNVRGAQMNVNQVHVTIVLTLTRGGKIVSSVKASEESWAGADTTGVALDIVERRAPELLAQLYSDYCSQGK